MPVVQLVLSLMNQPRRSQQVPDLLVAERRVCSPCDGQSERSQTVGFANSRAFERSFELSIAASWESAPSRSFGCVQSACDSQREAKLFAVLILVPLRVLLNSPSRLRGSLHPRGASGVLSPSKAKLLALLIPVFAVLLSKSFISRIAINKKAPVFRLGLFYLLGAWRCTTLAWQLPHYHRRSCVSLLSSEWIQVVPQRYCHQAKTVCLSLTKAS